ncbi:MAG: peptidylprolyl isomerase [Wenzhouxiangellaceae bacterium]|nr:peptidylprolyl isomerase [Wenzhouxiangellaceae bacterium]
MKKTLSVSALSLLLVLYATSVLAQTTNPRVWLDTDEGAILLELDAQRAPITTDNFLAYVNSGFYDGIVFHRVIDGFVVQGGGFDRNLRFRQPAFPAIASERGNGLANEPGTIAMALTSSNTGTNVDSATSQFFINDGTNSGLDSDFTVFGRVIAGRETVARISALRTGASFPDSLQQNGLGDVPIKLPAIRRAAEVAPGAFPLMPLHTGSWFDPARSGVGFNLEITNDASTETGPLLIVYWYDFSQGQAIWLTGVSAFEFGAHEVTVDLIAAEDGLGDFLTPPPRGGFAAQGQLTIEFSGCTNGSVRYALDAFGSGEVPVTRLSRPVDASCEGLD